MIATAFLGGNRIWLMNFPFWVVNMGIGKVFILAIIQGITEFLPISSSGHLVIFQNFFGFSNPLVSFDVLLHLGTLTAIIFFFRRNLVDLIANWQKKKRLFLLILIGSLPAGFVGYFFKEQLKNLFGSLLMVGIDYLITAAFLFSLHFIRSKRSISLGQIKISDAFFIGLFQALAILPGISRSGSTIVAGFWRKLSGEAAFYFSFLLAIPAIIGSSFFELDNLQKNGISLSYGFLGFIISGFVGYLSLKFLSGVVKKGKFDLFGWYCLIVGFWLVFRVL